MRFLTLDTLQCYDVVQTCRRSVVESVIGHLKLDHLLDRCFLWCRGGDRLNLVGSAAGFTAPAVKKFTEPGAEAPVLPHRALFVLC